MKFRFIITLATFLLFSSTSSAEITVHKLPSGKEIKIISIGKIYMMKDTPALTLNYETNIDIENVDLLRKEAELIWPAFRANVEQSGLINAVISARTPPIKKALVFHTQKNYNFPVTKNQYGTWAFTSWNRDYENEAKLKAIECLEILRDDSINLKNTLHYPENFTAQQLKDEINAGKKIFTILQDKFGKINSYKPNESNEIYEYFAIQTGSRDYWNKNPYFTSLIYEVDYEKKGKGYMEFRFSIIKDEFEISSIFYGLPSQNPETHTFLQKISEDIIGTLKNT